MVSLRFAIAGCFLPGRPSTTTIHPSRPLNETNADANNHTNYRTDCQPHCHIDGIDFDNPRFGTALPFRHDVLHGVQRPLALPILGLLRLQTRWAFDGFFCVSWRRHGGLHVVGHGGESTHLRQIETRSCCTQQTAALTTCSVRTNLYLPRYFLGGCNVDR